MDYIKHNEEMWDAYVHQGDLWTKPITREAYAAAQQGELNLYLTPSKPVPREWFPNLQGADVLGLASGGGQQGPVFAAHHANVTVLDVSEEQLRMEQEVSEREGYAIGLVKADMTQRFPFEDESFDLIFHPVANCYVEEIQPVWEECFRVLRPGGTLLVGFCKEEQFLFEVDRTVDPPLVVRYTLPFNALKNPELLQEGRRVTRGYSFSHTLEEQIGGQLRAGFCLAGIYDDRERGGILAKYFHSYAATRSIKPR